EPRLRGEVDPPRTQARPDVGTIGHRRKGPSIWATAPAPRGPAIVGGFVWIVETRGSVTDDDHELASGSHESHRRQPRGNDIRHLLDGVAATRLSIVNRRVMRELQPRTGW